MVSQRLDTDSILRTYSSGGDQCVARAARNRRSGYVPPARHDVARIDSVTAASSRLQWSRRSTGGADKGFLSREQIQYRQREDHPLKSISGKY